MDINQINLPVDELPKKWYNVMPHLPEAMPPPKEPETGPSRMKFLEKTMIHECLGQEMSNEPWIAIPEELRELYIQAGRPRPLYRARRLEKRLGLKKVRLYYKREDLSPTGSHKVNTAVAQAYYAVKEGKTTLATETGAGQWGSALSYAAALMGLDAVVFWVRAVHNWKSDRLTLMKLLGAKVHASPSQETKTGRELLAQNANHPGSLGIAVSEGLEYADQHEGTVYCLGSVLNHVLIHQSIIGLEAIKQFELLQSRRKEMMKTALMTAELLEPLPRSIVLASLTNELPAGTSLMEVKFNQKEPAGKTSTSAYQAKKAASGGKTDSQDAKNSKDVKNR